MRFVVAALVVVLLASWGFGAELPKRVTVEAGGVERRQTIVSFPLKGAKGLLRLRPEQGEAVACWCDGETGTFVLDALAANGSRAYAVEAADEPKGMDVRVEREAGGAIVFSDRDGERYREVLAYQSAKVPPPEGFDPAFTRGGYISPVMTPSGKVLTDDYPPNHKHHHGIWSPWTKTEYEGRHPDFWNMGDKTGRVEPAGVEVAEGWAVAGRLRASHRFVDMQAKPEKVALTEEWELVVYRRMGDVGRPYYAFDLTSTQHAQDAPLVLPQYRYGGLGVRGRREWQKDAVTFLTSEGSSERGKQDKRGRWCWMGGKDEGGHTIGLAVLSHPSNFRAPQPIWLNATEPFLCFAPEELGEFRIEVGKPYVSRYRFIAADGAVDAKELDRLWTDYAEPPRVTVE